MDNWRYKENGSWTGEYIKPVGTKTFTLSDSAIGVNVTPWEVYLMKILILLMIMLQNCLKEDIVTLLDMK